VLSLGRGEASKGLHCKKHKHCQSPPLDIIAYLERIGYTDVIDVTDEVLTRLHKKHVYQIPFENLDVYYKRIFNLDIRNVYQKVINDKRGGFCYELNLLFNCLLTQIGFTSRIIASRIFNGDGTVGPEFDHMSIHVKTGKEYLLDVGYGDLFVTPIEITEGVQFDGRNYFQINKWNKNEYVISMSGDGLSFSKKYTFGLDVVDIKDFNTICFDKQTSPTSFFVKNVVCTKPTEKGRVTIFNNKLVEKNGESRMEQVIQSDEHLTRCLKDKFGMVIERTVK
jgi:N-hydroxyarylamine O-acetyltransferase